MKLYRKLIRPVHCYPGQGYEPKTKPVEKEEKWYPEEERERLEEKYGYLNEGHFSDLSFEEKYEPFPLKEPELTDLVEFGIKIGFLTPEKAKQLLLKEHKPIKPTINKYGKAYCVCGENVGIIPNSKNLPKVCLKYCPECGRRMIWEEVTI